VLLREHLPRLSVAEVKMRQAPIVELRIGLCATDPLPPGQRSPHVQISTRLKDISKKAWHTHGLIGDGRSVLFLAYPSEPASRNARRRFS
jgi:hypothetical protein